MAQKVCTRALLPTFIDVRNRAAAGQPCLLPSHGGDPTPTDVGYYTSIAGDRQASEIELLSLSSVEPPTADYRPAPSTRARIF